MSDEYSIPNAIVARLMKEALGEGSQLSVSKDARAAIARSTQVFIQYLTSVAQEFASKSKRATIFPDDVFAALEEVQFNSWVTTLRSELDDMQIAVKDKKKGKKGGDALNTSNASAGDDTMDAEDEDEVKDNENDADADEAPRSEDEADVDDSLVVDDSLQRTAGKKRDRDDLDSDGERDNENESDSENDDE
jgi:DNA polymerase epsilon subunit 3